MKYIRCPKCGYSFKINDQEKKVQCPCCNDFFKVKKSELVSSLDEIYFNSNDFTPHDFTYDDGTANIYESDENASIYGHKKKKIKIEGEHQSTFKTVIFWIATLIMLACFIYFYTAIF